VCLEINKEAEREAALNAGSSREDYADELDSDESLKVIPPLNKRRAYSE
jgi:hypothetical protein